MENKGELILNEEVLERIQVKRTLLINTLRRKAKWFGHILYEYFATGKRPLGRPKRRWEDSIRMDLKEIGINTRNWVDSAEDRDYWKALVNSVLNLLIP